MTHPQSAAGCKGLPEGDYLHISVSDTGLGMTAEAQAKIFDPFFTTNSLPAGRGLGLAATLSIIRSHGGAIDLVSSPGSGSTFKIFLPCSASSTGPQTAAALLAASERSAPGATILIVEDEELLRLAVSKALRKMGFSVIEVVDGTEAMNVIRTQADRIDMILLDLTLPGTPSREVFAEARRVRPSIKIVLTSAYDRKTAENFFGKQKIESFMRKPYRVADLAKLL